MTTQRHTKLLVSLFRSVTGRIFYVRFTLSAIRVCNGILLLYVIYLCAYLFQYGNVPNIPDNILILIILPACITAVGIFIMLRPVPIDRYIRFIDCEYRFNDSLNTAYDIIVKKRDWHDWNAPVLRFCNEHISNRTIRLSRCIPLNIKTTVAGLFILICLIILMFRFTDSPWGTQWRLSRIKSIIEKQAIALIDISDDIFKHDKASSEDDFIKLQSIAHDLRMLAKTDKPATSQRNLDSLIEDLSNMQAGFLDRVDLPPDTIDRLEKTKQSVQSLASTLDQVATSKKTGGALSDTSTKKGQGIGTQKAADDDSLYSAKKAKFTDSEILTIQKNGSEGSGTANTGRVDVSAEEATTSTVNTDHKEPEYVSQYLKTTDVYDKLKPVNIGTNLVDSPVWFETVPVTRRNHIRRYFSTSSDIREQK